jgi:hypothetical protein
MPHTLPRFPALMGTLTLLLCSPLLLSGCATSHPPPLSAQALAEAQTFPYYMVYWTGRDFEGYPITAADGRKGYSTAIGDSVYYGDCGQGVPRKLLGGTCLLPLQVTTVIYRLHSNATLGPQHNIVIRGVPATVYDEGHSIELYSGRVAIDIFSESPSQALRAAAELRPINAPTSRAHRLAAPIYCPGLSGPQGADVRRVMRELPQRVCQRTAAAKAAKATMAL